MTCFEIKEKGDSYFRTLVYQTMFNNFIVLLRQKQNFDNFLKQLTTHSYLLNSYQHSINYFQMIIANQLSYRTVTFAVKNLQKSMKLVAWIFPLVSNEFYLTMTRK